MCIGKYVHFQRASPHMERSKKRPRFQDISRIRRRATPENRASFDPQIFSTPGVVAGGLFYPGWGPRLEKIVEQGSTLHFSLSPHSSSPCLGLLGGQLITEEGAKRLRS